VKTPRPWLPIWCALALAIAAEARAQPAGACDPDEPTHCAVPLAQGAPAPFSGQLVTTELAISLGQKAEKCGAWTKLEVDRVAEMAEAERMHQAELRTIERDACREKTKSLETALDEVEARPWWEHPAFVAAVSVVGTTVVLTGLYVAAVKTIQALE
jgi:hypothetical protein